MNTANTRACLLLSELDVALVTPPGVPRVLDEPIFEACVFIDTIADGEDSMVKIGSTSIGGDNTTRIRLEIGVISFDQNREGLILQSNFHLVDIVGGNIGILADVYSSCLGGAVLARFLTCAVSRGIRVVSLAHSGIGLVVSHGSSWPATVASIGSILRSVSAIDELLLREGEELTSGSEVSSFEGTCGGECPA